MEISSSETESEATAATQGLVALRVAVLHSLAMEMGMVNDLWIRHHSPVALLPVDLLRQEGAVVVEPLEVRRVEVSHAGLVGLAEAAAADKELSFENNCSPVWRAYADTAPVLTLIFRFTWECMYYEYESVP